MAAPGENLRINSDRLWDSIMEMAKIGPGIAGGNNRQTLTDSDKQGRELFKSWCDQAGLTMGVDQMGTMFMTRAGTDPDALPFGDELKRIGWVGDEKVGARKMHAYFEYHIEQGPILEAENKQIGVVTHCQGLWWLEFTLTGREAHTGSTPMNLRVNAGLAMARILEMVQTVAMENQPGAVGGV